ncbi:hypothetical protein, partial [Parapedobacter soli]|uniref:hypothetical protein n=1 Tax=Parapedobacter soli TaxID=416955 RepID=UPI0021C6DE69
KVIMVFIFFVSSCFAIRAHDRPKFNWSGDRFVPVKIKVENGMVRLAGGNQQLTFKGELFRLDAAGKLKTEWTKSEDDFTTLYLTAKSEKETRLNHVIWFAGAWEKGVERVVHSTKLMDNVLFIRKKGISFFLSLDFPYSRIDSTGIQYPASVLLGEGQTYQPHSLSIGACKLSGEMVGEFDRAEIEAVSTYIERRFPARFERPMVLSAGITNRMTDVREGRIFYSMYDNPTVSLSPELVAEDLHLNAELGIEYYQVFEGVFDWPDGEQTGRNMDSLQRIAKSLGVRMGDYVVPQGLYCPHYNFTQRKLNRPDWKIREPGGGLAHRECLAVDEYVDMMTNRLVEHNKKYGLQIICLDFLNIKPCYANDHHHPPGDTYQQIKGLVKMMSALNETDENFLVWSNSGNWLELMPKLIWYNPNVYLTDPHVRQYAPHLNILKNLGDGRREQMVSVHNRYFVPYRAFTNYEYYIAPNSRLADPRVFEYSFLQGLAVTPNLGLGEIRSFLDRVSSKDNARMKKFIRHWLDFIRDNFDVWKHTSQLGDAPGTGAAEVYGHIKKDRGFLCFVNQNAFPVHKELVLGGTIGLSEGNAFLLSEIYPESGPIIEQPVPFARRGDTIQFTLAPYQVRFVRVEPYTNQSPPAVYGASPLRIDKSGDGYYITLKIPQGRQKQIALVLPDGERVREVTAAHHSLVPMFTFPVHATLLQVQENQAFLSVQGPREEAPTTLTRWRVGKDSSYRQFPVAQHEGFLGAYIHNAFSEDYEVVLKVDVERTNASRTTKRLYPPAYRQPSVALAELPPKAGTVTYQTEFILPFIERYGLDRDEQQDAIIEFGFSDPGKAVITAAKLNGKDVPVGLYTNSKNRAHKTHYLELKGQVAPGKVTLEIEVTYQDTAAPKKWH